MADPLKSVMKFLGIGPFTVTRTVIPSAQMETKHEYCVSISCLTGKIEHYHYAKDDESIVPKTMDASWALTSSGAIWVHSYVSFEHAEKLAVERRQEFWDNTSFVSVYCSFLSVMDPVGQYELVVHETDTDRDKKWRTDWH